MVALCPNIRQSTSGVYPPENFFLALLGVKITSMTFGVEVLIVLTAVIVNLSFGINAIHFRSVGKNYNINYNSNTNTNLDLSQLYETIAGGQLDGLEIKAPLLPTLCSSQLYEHLAASFSSDQDEFEEDYYFYDDIDNEDTLLFPEEASDVITSTTPSEGDHSIVKLIMPTSDENNKLEIVELDPVEAPQVNQSDQIIPLDTVAGEVSSE